MKKLAIYSTLLVIIILGINGVYYKNLYHRQINYVVRLLSQQVALIGSEIGNTNLYFESDASKIFFDVKIEEFFRDEYVRERVTEKLKFFYSKYSDFIVNIKLNNINAENFTLYQDSENDDWIANMYLSQEQSKIVQRDILVPNRDKFDYYLPVIDSKGLTIGNFIVTVDYVKYFHSQFNKYKLEDYQWQWLISEDGKILFTNYFSTDFTDTRNIDGIKIRNLDVIYNNLTEEISGNLIHRIDVNGESEMAISSYYPVTVLKKDFGMVFSAPSNFYQAYIVRNSILIVSLTIFLIIVLVFIFYRYVKRQKTTSAILRESEQTFIRLIELMPVGVVIIDEDKEVLKANEAAAIMFSYGDEKRMEGKLMPENIHSGEGLFYAENLGAGYEPNQFMVVKKEGVDIILYRKEIPVIFNSERATMLVLIDVTLLEVARKQEARANEAKSEFLAKMSYEIRTPLNGIIGMADILTGMDKSKEVNDVVELIRKSSDLLLGIINDLLDFSKIEARSLMLDEIPFNVNKEIEYCINVASTIKKDDVEILWNVDKNVPDSLIGDPFRLRQVITNLLFTSLEHTDKGKIVINCEIDKSGMEALFLKFDMKDTGKGYDKKSFKKMFGDYIRAESKSILGYEGKGLTGVISKQLIELMGGDLTPSTPSGISDDPEAPGARFVFSVKVYSNERIQKSYGADKITKYSEIKTLVISGGRERDEELLNALHKFGLTTYVTSWQKQTLSLIKSNLNHENERYKMVIILDVEDFDGFKVGKEIWEKELYKEFMILMVSSNDQRGNYSRCIYYGIDNYLVKPFHLSELFDIIQNRFPNIESDLDPALLEDLRKDLNILIVEDNLINQKVAITILKSLGYEVDVASNGEEGINMAGDKNYDLIFMDLIMPVVDGYEAARKILQNNRNVKIVALTADSTTESIKKAELSGIELYISKPVKQEEVRKILINLFAETVG